jgi:hypothetical protein
LGDRRNTVKTSGAAGLTHDCAIELRVFVRNANRFSVICKR